MYAEFRAHPPSTGAKSGGDIPSAVESAPATQLYSALDEVGNVRAALRRIPIIGKGGSKSGVAVRAPRAF